jgi:hypothetical protein
MRWRGRFGVGICLAGLAVLALLVSPAVAQVSGEHIRGYDVDLTIGRDGVLTVVERVDYDFGTARRHGIFRDIPVRFHFNDRYDRLMRLDVRSVEGSPGTPTKYRIEKIGSILRIRVGDSNRTITGLHTYTLTYRIQGALNGFPDHDELYWNAIGADWDVPIERATVRVTAPADVQRVACFAGLSGSSLPCSEAVGSGSVARFKQMNLGPQEGLTVVVGFQAGVVPPPRPILQEQWSFARAFAVTPLTGGVAGGLVLLLFFLIGRLMWITGRDRRARGSPVDVAFGSPSGGEEAVPLFERGTNPVEYAPPEGIRPGQVGTLVDEQANPLDATATIVDLAVRGYLRIEEIPKHGLFGKPDWRLVRLKEDRDGLLDYERMLLDGLFEDGDVDRAVTLSSLKRKFAARLWHVQEALYDDMVKEGWFVGRPDRIRSRWRVLGLGVLAAGILVTWIVAAKSHLGLLPVPVLLAGLLLLWGSHLMPRRTAKGTGLVRRVFGFRRYIETAEAQEARFQERENIFSKYLPYAIVFGCTEKWARAFGGLDEQKPAPSVAAWYVGTQAFSVGQFGSAIEHFSTVTAGTVASAAAGSSGFGGGGVGGGGGGGGGGSW